MDEIKSIISELPPTDIATLKAIYNPDAAKSELTQEGQRLIPLIDGLSPDEQAEAVNVEAAPLEGPAPEGGDVSVDVAMMEGGAPDMGGEIPEDEEEKNWAGNFEDFLI